MKNDIQLSSKPKGVSLFACGGVGDLALRDAGVELLVANELEPDRAAVLEQNFPEAEIIAEDIWQASQTIVNTTRAKLQGQTLDFLLATPPCQGMSKNGRGKLLAEIRNGNRPKFDPRNQLIIPTLAIIKELLPQIVFFENVPEMASTIIEHDDKPSGILEHIENELSPLGYVGGAQEVQFADYGVPQRRKRLITVYSRNPTLISHWEIYRSYIPQPTHNEAGTDGASPWVTVRDVISHLEPLDAVDAQKSTGTCHPLHRVSVLEPRKYNWVASTPAEQGAFDNQCTSCGYDENALHGSSRKRSGRNQPKKTQPL